MHKGTVKNIKRKINWDKTTEDIECRPKQFELQELTAPKRGFPGLAATQSSEIPDVILDQRIRISLCKGQ